MFAATSLQRAPRAVLQVGPWCRAASSQKRAWSGSSWTATYINLDRRKDRRDAFTQLCSLNAPDVFSRLSRCSAVDGKSLVWTRLPPSLVSPEAAYVGLCAEVASKPTLTRNTDEFSPHLTRGGVGCALAHREAWRGAAKFGGTTLIFEDDVVFFARGFDARFKAIAASLPPGWDICYFGYHGGAPGPTDSMEDGYDILRAEGLVTGLYCYAVSSKGAEKLIDLVFPLQVQVDVAISMHFHELSAWKVHNAKTLAMSFPSQVSMDSDIQVIR
mmetsp:Transcript_49020/g.129516  ORF Transcript_49020/g.129516 Transcript_49020/m.129516 type:complete len:272 (-) Transcript_49020:68-883(-)